jgi:hypothetical protein
VAFVARRTSSTCATAFISTGWMRALFGPVLDRSATDLLAARLSAGDPQEIVRAGTFRSTTEARFIRPCEACSSRSAEVRQRAIALLAAPAIEA